MFNNHRWYLRFFRSGTTPEQRNVFNVALSGVVISLLLFGIALTLSATRARAEVMANNMTAAFRDANASLQNEIRDRQRSQRRAVIQHAVTRVLADADALDEAAPVAGAHSDTFNFDDETVTIGVRQV